MSERPGQLDAPGRLLILGVLGSAGNMGCGGSCAQIEALRGKGKSRKVGPEGVLPVPDRAIHRLYVARLDRYLGKVSQRPDAFILKVELRRSEASLRPSSGNLFASSVDDFPGEAREDATRHGQSPQNLSVGVGK
ncbi:unnamed protein product [Symbiodinium natans]|uniref:Uncharacterized protein n=1 Tax=Symbiodinium natans TaxID=878477 RepID=A0A812MJ95_9DINO|nr:unnamed protein product [Symbiodinium natans]